MNNVKVAFDCTGLMVEAVQQIERSGELLVHM